MEKKGLIILVLAFLGILFISCQQENPEVSQPTLISYFTSDSCIAEPTKSGTTQVEINIEGLEITVKHLAIFNCCLDSILVSFAQAGDTLKIMENEVTPNPCYCLCGFQIISHIEVPNHGTYVIEIWADDKLVWREAIHV